MFQFNHLRNPIGLLRVVEGDASALEVRDSGVLPPGGGVTAAAQEHVVGRGRGTLGPQLPLTSRPFIRQLRNLGTTIATFKEVFAR